MEMGCPVRVAVDWVEEALVAVAVAVQVGVGCIQTMMSKHGIASVSCRAG
jgi:hypothetical protein